MFLIRSHARVATVAFWVSAVTLVLFGLDYSWQLNLPGYQLFAQPGVFLLGFFSEELPFATKLLLLLVGQYLFYGACWWVIRHLWHRYADQ